MNKSIPDKCHAFIKEARKRREVSHNDYTIWWSKGNLTDEDLADNMIQGAGFGNGFLVAAAIGLVNSVALGLEVETEMRWVLVTELGVRKNRVFEHAAAHINWARDTASVLGLSPPKIPYTLGDQRMNSPATALFIQMLEDGYRGLYPWKPAHAFRRYQEVERKFDPSFMVGFWHGIEWAWASFGLNDGEEAYYDMNFWVQQERGIEIKNEERVRLGLKPIDPKIWSDHKDDERGHGEASMNMLAPLSRSKDFILDRWQEGVMAALDSVGVYYFDGLNASRLLRASH